MNFREMYDAVSGMTEDGKNKIRIALHRLEAMGEAGTEEQREEAATIAKSGLDRLEAIDNLTRRIRNNVHALALMCMDTSIPVEQEEPREVV